MRCLSVRAPWWWFILYAGKDIENRPWNCHKRGPIGTHPWSKSRVAALLNGAARRVLPKPSVRERGESDG